MPLPSAANATANASSPYSSLSAIPGISNTYIVELKIGVDLSTSCSNPIYSYARDAAHLDDALPSLVQFGIDEIRHASDIEEDDITQQQQQQQQQQQPPPPSLSFKHKTLRTPYNLINSTPKSVTLISTCRSMIYMHFATSYRTVIICKTDGNPTLPNVVRMEIEKELKKLRLD